MSFLASLFRHRDRMRKAPAEHALAGAEDAKARGNEHLAKGELDEAAACYREAVKRNRDFAEAYNNLGYVLKEQQRFAEAGAMLDTALRLKPDLGPACLNKGVVAHALGQQDVAVAAFRLAAQLMPGNAECRWRLGDLLMETGESEDAIACYRAALDIEPRLPDTLANLGSAYYKLGRWPDAERCYAMALEIVPQSAHVAYFAGMTAQMQGRTDDAMMAYRRAVAADPGHGRAHWNLAMLLLLQGDYPNGWEHFEKRLLAAADNEDWMKDVRRYLPLLGEHRLWHGEPLQERRLLIWDEQGLGDTLMMLRYLPLVRERGAGEVIVWCDPRLVRLVSLLPDVDRVIAKPEAVAAASFDVHCSTMSLPFLLGSNSQAAIPRSIPYLKVDAGTSIARAERLAALGLGRKVGLVWGGNKELARDALRSVALRTFAPLFDLPGIVWVSLQKGEAAAQLADLGLPVVDWMDECRDLLDTAGIVANLDLVISVDTSMAHLAGALGRPVWLLNRHESEWRWMLGREDSPWYPSMRIFTQPRAHDWDSVITRIRQELEGFA